MRKVAILAVSAVIALTGALLSSTSAPVTAQGSTVDDYAVTVTREAGDLYRVDLTSYWIETRYCYEYAYSEDATLHYDSPYGYTKGTLEFEDSGATCDVAEVYEGIEASELPTGTKVFTGSDLEEFDAVLVPTELE